MATGKGWIEDLVARLGIPEPIYASGRLERGQAVKVLLDWPEERVAEADALGKKDRKGRHKITYIDRKGRAVVVWKPRGVIIVGYVDDAQGGAQGGDD